MPGTSGGVLYRFFGMTKETTVDNIKDAMRRRGLHEKMITVEKAGQRWHSHPFTEPLCEGMLVRDDTAIHLLSRYVRVFRWYLKLDTTETCSLHLKKINSFSTFQSYRPDQSLQFQFNPHKQPSWYVVWCTLMSRLTGSGNAQTIFSSIDDNYTIFYCIMCTFTDSLWKDNFIPKHWPEYFITVTTPE